MITSRQQIKRSFRLARLQFSISSDHLFTCVGQAQNRVFFPPAACKLDGDREALRIVASRQRHCWVANEILKECEANELARHRQIGFTCTCTTTNKNELSKQYHNRTKTQNTTSEQPHKRTFERVTLDFWRCCCCARCNDRVNLREYLLVNANREIANLQNNNNRQNQNDRTCREGKNKQQHSTLPFAPVRILCL